MCVYTRIREGKKTVLRLPLPHPSIPPPPPQPFTVHYHSSMPGSNARSSESHIVHVNTKYAHYDLNVILP